MVDKISEETRELDILFPSKKIELADGIFVTVRPLNLEDLPKVLNDLKTIASALVVGASPIEIGVAAAGEVMRIAKYCVDRPLNKVPAAAMPEIIETIIDQNITETVVSKIQSLIKKLEGLGKLDQGQSKAVSGSPQP